jgi:outer membrane protein assembly factor BamE (lipoprotein component of BamABCDE complex)
MLKLKYCVLACVACVLSVLFGCASEPVATDVMSRVHVGMTKDDVIDRLGPPDGNWGPWHSQCLEYGFQKYAKDRYALYVNNQERVIYIEHANCNVKRAESLGLR